MFKKVCVASVLVLSTAVNAQCDFLEDLAPFQREVAYQSYLSGDVHNLGLTSVAIAWEESKLGLYKLRIGEGIDISVGVGHTLVAYQTRGMSTSEKSVWMQGMMENNPKSIGYMVKDIVSWQKRAKGNWKKGVAMYNGGYNPNYEYAGRVVDTLHILEQCEF